MAQRKKKFQILPMHIIMLIPAAIIVVGMIIRMVTMVGENPNLGRPDGTNPGSQTTATTEAKPYVTATATLGSQGDLLMHKPIFRSGSAVYQGNDKYDFSSIFEYTNSYTEKLDYMVANLETTFGGDKYPYQGNPAFNCPDSLLDALTASGYDMLLTCNNHSNDTLADGMARTITQIRAKGLDALGTRLSADETRYVIEELNGIKVGMVSYTYAAEMRSGKPSLNFNTPVEKPEQINYYCEVDLDSFYKEAQAVITQMEQAGAEAIVFYIHWGQEYKIEENTSQNTMAQRLCDMGVDVIIGGHPHVVQPVELLSSTTNASHKTVCIYSLGNAVSNQRIAEMSLKTGHTEDGALFTVTFEKYSDGSVYVASADVLPTWVNLHENTGKKEYNVLPLDDETREEWKNLYTLTDAQVESAKASYDRTMAIVGEGLETVNTYLQSQKPE